VDGAGGIDVLVNNAGAAAGPMPTLERPDASWLADLEMNLLSSVRLDRALVPGMVERGAGRTPLLRSLGLIPKPSTNNRAGAVSAKAPRVWCAGRQSSSSTTSGPRKGRRPWPVPLMSNR
jgi:NAD(P)-dependent dehydrogenase (short-subunit alcohol dehydrogenase family)